MEGRRIFPKIDEGDSPSLLSAVESGDDLAIDELSRKMLSWSRLWSGALGSSSPTEEHYLVRERLLSCLKRCIGLQARCVLTRRGEEITLATSTPLLVALLGRRATRELSRRVLNGL
jgi:hypothetical protein